MRHAYGLATVLAVGLGASTMLAAERATFVLTDGERVSGEVVFHTEARTNIRADKNEFNVKVADGTERPIPFSHVVLIDFIGGNPRDEELAAVPQAGHLLTLRNGDTKVGRFVDMVGGTTIIFDELNGGRIEVPITSARRAFLQPDRVRETFDVAGAVSRVRPSQQNQNAGRSSQQPSGGRRGGRGGNQEQAAANVEVRGADAWTDTGLTVKRGQRLSFRSSGTVYVGRVESAAGGAAGSHEGNEHLPLPSARLGALIGRIGNNGTPFLIGDNTSEMAMQGTGRLMLRINDNVLEDNSGVLSVTINR